MGGESLNESLYGKRAQLLGSACPPIGEIGENLSKVLKISRIAQLVAIDWHLPPELTWQNSAARVTRWTRASPAASFHVPPCVGRELARAPLVGIHEGLAIVQFQ